MKTTIVAVVLLIVLAGCYTHKELEAEMVRAEVIRIDTIERYSHNVPTRQKQLTWRANNQEYVTFVPMYAYYKVGTSMTMLKPR